jgi:hypothetical protein
MPLYEFHKVVKTEEPDCLSRESAAGGSGFLRSVPAGEGKGHSCSAEAHE